MESEILMGKYSDACPLVKKVVLPTMNQDEIFDVLKNDSVILELSSQVLKKQQDQRYQAAQKMRGAARILKRLRAIDPDGGCTTMEEFLKPTKFDLFVQAVEEEAGLITGDDYNDDNLERPSFAIKAGHDLGWMARIKRGMGVRAFRDGDTSIREIEAAKFIDLLDSEWSHKVSASAKSTLQNRKSKKAESLPKTEDLKVSEYLSSEVRSCVNQIEQKKSTDISYSLFKHLQQVTMLRLLLFNKRRPRELSKITVDRVNLSSQDNARVDELLNHLTSLERMLKENLHVIKIIAKGGRIVPVIIPQECVRSLELILELRHLFIPTDK